MITLLGLAACGHSPTIQEYSVGASPSEEIQKLDVAMTSAYRDQVDMLAPNSFENAKVSLTEAKSQLDKQKDPAKTLHTIATANSYLKQAIAASQVAHANIEEVISARKQAIAAGATKHFDKEFMATDRQLREVTSDLEKNEVASAEKNRTRLQNEYLNLELLSIKTESLHSAGETIEQAKTEGAKSLAPRSLAIAEKKYRDTDAFITANRHDAQVNVRSEESKALAVHLLKITRASKLDKKTSSEELALRNENDQNLASEKDAELQAKETVLKNQGEELTTKDMQLAKSENVLQNKNAELTGAALALNESNNKADAEKEFNQKYETARSEFSEQEAEVYKQGDALVIRLKALEFPNSKANLKAANFSLLAKVEKVIKSFGPSSVVIEGHTDSVGGKVVNEKLSVQRAQAIREYFIANSVTDSGKISAIGYDYQKPIASNKTPSGRAQNRRVDIRILPDKTTSL